MDVRKEFRVCALCGSCREVCPLKRILGFDTYVPRGKIQTTKSHHYGESFPKKLIDNWYLCSTCGYCKEVCPTNIDIIELVKTIRTELVTNNLGTHEAYHAIRNIIQKTGNPFEKPAEDRAAWIPQDYKPPEKTDYVYMAGCYASYSCQEIATSISDVLNTIDFPYGLFGPSEPCCGMIIEWGGEKDVFMEEAKKNVEVINSVMKKYDAQSIFTSCPGCYTTLSEEYPKLVGKLDFEVLHASELFARLIDEGKIDFQKRFKATVTYQDPCHLGRFHNIYESPRKIIESIPGLKFVEMDHNRNEANCCGGLLRTSHARYAIDQAGARSKEAALTGASTLLTFCPLCYSNLHRVAKRQKLETLDIPMLMKRLI
ncbi:MAG: (Fe-S)-binding protein [Candidatus Bathyarchaeota archaeon]|nr:MAG: (Fe-S)-binding protein [Candidatus Bathyarchaeota archaeon]